MLVLGRKKDETVELYLDGTLLATIQVANIRGDRVRLGFTALDDIRIKRGEIPGDLTRNHTPRNPKPNVIPEIQEDTKRNIQNDPNWLD